MSAGIHEACVGRSVSRTRPAQQQATPSVAAPLLAPLVPRRMSLSHKPSASLTQTYPLIPTQTLYYICCRRDWDGHGSHTASTAAGNYGDTSNQAPSGAVLSGMAPRARLAIYKAL